MKIIEQDMLALEEGILFHQVNCRGIMGGGIARSFALKWPELEIKYREYCQIYDTSQEQLIGRVWMFNASPTIRIANVFGQGDVSRTKRMTSYDATVTAFERIVNSRRRNPESKYWNGQFYFPYKMGCGLGGGNWDIYSKIIETYFPDAIICKYEPKS